MQHLYFFIQLWNIVHFIVPGKGNAEACVSVERCSIIFTDFSNEASKTKRAGFF